MPHRSGFSARLGENKQLLVLALAGDRMNLRKEDTNMKYDKPDILIIGNALDVIQGVNDKSLQQISDAPLQGEQTNAAYDLDE
jgi:hypothetical protein